MTHTQAMALIELSEKFADDHKEDYENWRKEHGKEMEHISQLV